MPLVGIDLYKDAPAERVRIVSQAIYGDDRNCECAEPFQDRRSDPHPLFGLSDRRSEDWAACERRERVQRYHRAQAGKTRVGRVQRGGARMRNSQTSACTPPSGPFGGGAAFQFGRKS